MRTWVALLALLSLCCGCRCAEPTDEEKLRARIDTTSVHLYLASKIAILKADETPEARAAHDALVQALTALEGQPAGTDEQGRTVRKMTAADALALAKALLELREQGQALLSSGDEKGMKPVLPRLFNAPPELEKVLDLNHEHALLMSATFVLKFHPKAPVPVPAEVVLYEAWMTRSKELLPGLRSFVHMEKAVVYGSNELCDLASAEARGVDEEQASYEDVLATLDVAGAGQQQVAAENVRQSFAAASALAHGVSAYCHDGRDEKDEALAELDATLAALEASGVPKEQLALLRAYAAMRRDDPKTARVELQMAHDYEGTDAETKADLALLLANLEEDPNVFEAKLGKGWFMFTLAKIVLRRLDELGVFDELKQTELVRTLDRFVMAAADAGSSAGEFVDPRGWLEQLSDRFSN